MAKEGGEEVGMEEQKKTNRRKFSKEFFFKCFLVKYLRYRLEKGIWEVRTSLLPDCQLCSNEMTWGTAKRVNGHETIYSRQIDILMDIDLPIGSPLNTA